MKPIRPTQNDFREHAELVAKHYRCSLTLEEHARFQVLAKRIQTYEEWKLKYIEGSR